MGGADSPPPPGLLDRLQRGLESMYRIDTELSVGDFVIDDDLRRRLGVRRAPREQLLCTQRGEALEIGLFVDRTALANLDAHDPAAGLHDANLGDFLLAVEGVSHFVYLAWRARAARPVSALELELQAEVDKYVTCLLTGGRVRDSDTWRQRLFEQFELEADLDAGERSRYQAANAGAHRYSASLERRFVRRRRIADMLAELRRFYRMSLAAKLEFIARAA